MEGVRFPDFYTPWNLRSRIRGERGSPSNETRLGPLILLAHFKTALFEHNNHGDDGGDGTERKWGRHHYEPAADTSGDPYGPMVWRNFASKVSDLISWFPPTKVTVIYIKSDNC